MGSNRRPQVGKTVGGGDLGSTPWSDAKELPFIPDQVILAGPISQLGEIPGLEEIRSHELPVLLEEVVHCVKGLMEGADRGGKVLEGLGWEEPWVLTVRRILDGRSPAEWIEEISGTTSLLADANMITGDPHTAVGSPHTAVGSPRAGNGRPASQAEFVGQWVWGGPYGIETPMPAPPTRRACRIGVFDTSPCPFGAWGDALDILIPWAVPGLQLKVYYPEPVAILPPPAGGLDVREHGLSVASLAHSVAPGSDLYLYRVLDDYARGDTYTLIWSLASFTADTVREGRGGVINLSLGISGTIDWRAFGLPDDIATLRLVLAIAHCLGLVTAAAAGNDSWALPAPEPAQIPARYDFVIGAMASTVEGTRACFSNAGQVAAPGCGVITVLSTPDSFGYSSGTSFATPLVAGVAARHVPGAPNGQVARDDTVNSARPPHPNEDPGFRVIKAP